MSGFPQGSILVLVFFNTFISDIDSESSTLSKFSDDIKLSGAAETTERRDVTQRDVGRL